jgi:undecaprenyl phosphate N,N'-diacetylbacillosamine 1-phosphate transferase
MQSVLKRSFDLVVAILGLVAFGWLLVLVYIIASIDTRSNGLFIQTRIGRAQKPFSIYKFRTMRSVQGMVSSTTTKNDPRVTRVGNVLRKTKIDELPQLLNVLNGTMSLVGPRPTVAEDVARMDATQRRRCDVRPGITGLAQVSGSTALSWPERIKYDLQYVDNVSLLLDIQILLKTVALLLTMRAETHPTSADEWDMTAPQSASSDLPVTQSVDK